MINNKITKTRSLILYNLNKNVIKSKNNIEKKRRIK